jgi:peptidoglycan/LPS O-acetylase OafA/YrhL
MMEESKREENKLINSNGELKSVLSYRPELDGLRAIAVLAVILYHAGFSFCRGGFLGVDIFFVLSGYLMTSIILREEEANEFTLARFYERRVRRILPMLFFTISVCYLPAYKMLTETEFLYFTKSAFLASIGLSNFLFAEIVTGYFDAGTDLIPLIHTWTLGVEEQFYVIIPLIFILFWRFGRNVVLYTITALALVSFGLTLVDLNASRKFYMLYTRFWELGIGSIVVFIPKQKSSNLISYIGLSLILVAIFQFDKSIPNPSYFTLFPTIGTALVILFTDEKIIVGRVLSLKPFVWIGLISYSAYLIHQPLFTFARSQSLSKLPDPIYIVLILAVFCLSYLTWRFIENTFRNRKQISIHLIFMHVLVYFVFLRLDTVSLVLMKPVQFISSNPETDKLMCTKGLIQNKSITLNSSILYKSVPEDSLFNYGEHTEIGKNCFMRHSFGNKDTKPQLCRVGRDNTSSPAYFLFGDSMSVVARNAFDQLETPGMCAGLNGQYCSPLFRSTPSPSMVTKNGNLN